MNLYLKFYWKKTNSYTFEIVNYNIKLNILFGRTDK